MTQLILPVSAERRNVVMSQSISSKLAIAAFAICAASAAFAQTPNSREWRSVYQMQLSHQLGAQSCTSYDERAQGYINSCGEYIPSRNDPDAVPGNG
jgi:hypothetical protein